MIGTALVVLGAAGVAYAASHFNNYTGSQLAFSKGAGTKAKPVGLRMIETLKASAPSGDRAAPLTDVKLKIYGVKLDAGKLPVCTDAKILQNKTNPDGGCSPKSVIGDGPVHALLGPSASPSNVGTVPCNPFLRVFNGGPHHQVFYYYTKSPTDCGGLTTGATAPYDGSISYSGGSAVIDIPQPADVSTKVANQTGLYGSLIALTQTFPKKVGGKSYMVGVGCKNGKRPWSITITSQNYDGSHDTQTVKGSSKC